MMGDQWDMEQGRDIVTLLGIKHQASRYNGNLVEGEMG
jgi:hypothetical protein